MTTDGSGYLPEFCIPPYAEHYEFCITPYAGLFQFTPEIQRFIFYQVEQRSTVLIKQRIVLQNSIVTRLLTHEIAHLSEPDDNNM